MTAKKKAATTVEKAVKPTEVAPIAEVIETASKKPAAKPIWVDAEVLAHMKELLDRYK